VYTLAKSPAIVGPDLKRLMRRLREQVEVSSDAYWNDSRRTDGHVLNAA